MNPSRKLFSSAATVVLLLFFSCDDEISAELRKLPPATYIGANTCGCLVNGKAWVSSLPNPDTVLRFQSIGGFTQWFAIPFQAKDTLTIISRLWPDPRVIGVEHDVIKNFGWAHLTTSMYGIYNSVYSPKNEVSITFSKYDLDNRIMAGSFYMKLHPPDSLKGERPVLEFTNCRFDFQFWHP